MASDRMMQAIGRIERALDRLERAVDTLPPTGSEPDAQAPTTLRAEATEALRSLDSLIAELKENACG